MLNLAPPAVSTNFAIFQLGAKCIDWDPSLAFRPQPGPEPFLRTVGHAGIGLFLLILSERVHLFMVICYAAYLECWWKTCFMNTVFFYIYFKVVLQFYTLLLTVSNKIVIFILFHVDVFHIGILNRRIFCRGKMWFCIATVTYVYSFFFASSLLFYLFQVVIPCLLFFVLCTRYGNYVAVRSRVNQKDLYI